MDPVRSLSEGGGVYNFGGVFVFEHVVVAIGQERGGGVAIANRREFKEGGCDTNDLAQTLVWFVEPSADQVRAVCGGVGAGRRGREGLRGDGGIFEVEERRWVGSDGIRYACGRGCTDVHMVAAIVVYGGANVKRTQRVWGPRRACVGRVEGVTQLSNRMEGMSSKVKGETMEAVMSTHGSVGVPWL